MMVWTWGIWLLVAVYAAFRRRDLAAQWSGVVTALILAASFFYIDLRLAGVIR